MCLSKIKKSALIYSWISAVVILLDQVTKFLVLKYIGVDEIVRVFPFLNVTLRFNTGAAFSFLSNAGGWQVYLLGAISFVISVGLLIWISRLKRSNWLAAVPLCLILGGAIGNLIDRARLGHVIDFIDFHIGAWHYATFNVADIAVSVGAFLLVLELLFRKGA